jgi:hypothetical protein
MLLQVEVAVRLKPVLVGFDRQRPHQSATGGHLDDLPALRALTGNDPAVLSHPAAARHLLRYGGTSSKCERSMSLKPWK